MTKYKYTVYKEVDNEKLKETCKNVNCKHLLQLF